MARCWSFTTAVVRAPADSAVDGLRAADTGTPDLARFRADHAAYVAALRATGAAVVELPPLEDHPDSVFVEDTALCLPEGAVILRPGAPSRFGEAAAIAPTLERLYGAVVHLDPPGFAEGGDILATGREVLVGRSARTDAAGIAALGRVLAGWGVALREVATPPGVLHFKTDCALLDEATILATPRLAATGCFAGYRVIETPPGEEAGANAIRFNDLVLIADGFPRLAEALDRAGYRVRRIGNTEAAKLDGGMSCLSLRFTPPGG